MIVALERFGVEGADAAWAAAAHAFQVVSLRGPKDLRAQVDEAEAALRAAGDDETLEVGLRVLSLAHLIAADSQRAASATGEAVAIARRGGSPELLFVELVFHVQALVAAGRLHEADVCARQASVLLPDLAPDAAGYIASVRGDLALAREDWPAAAAEYTAQAGQAEDLRDHNDLVLALQESSSRSAASPAGMRSPSSSRSSTTSAPSSGSPGPSRRRGTSASRASGSTPWTPSARTRRSRRRSVAATFVLRSGSDGSRHSRRLFLPETRARAIATSACRPAYRRWRGRTHAIDALPGTRPTPASTTAIARRRRRHPVQRIKGAL